MILQTTLRRRREGVVDPYTGIYFKILIDEGEFDPTYAILIQTMNKEDDTPTTSAKKLKNKNALDSNFADIDKLHSDQYGREWY